MDNYYKILGVPKNATEKDIRQAYRKLARTHHPDVNPGNAAAEEKFKEINEAYSVISDTDKRKKYDLYGDNWAHADQMGEARYQTRASNRRRSNWSSFDNFNPSTSHGRGGSSIFNNLFKDLGQEIHTPPSPEYAVDITLEEAQQGTTRIVQVRDNRRLEVIIPAGVDQGSRVHIPAGQGGQGDFYLVVSVQSHPRFQRQGRNLYCDMDVPLEDVALGGEITVPTLSGQVALNIPPETQNDQRFRLTGQGMPSLNQSGRKGDLFATVKVVIPTGLTEDERNFFRKLKQSRSTRNG